MSKSPAQEFYDKYKVNDFMTEMINIANNDPDNKDKIVETKNNFVDYLSGEVNNIPMEELITLLMTLSNMDSDLSNGLIATANEKVIRASLLIEFFNGIFPELIRDNPKEATQIAFQNAKESEGTEEASYNYKKFIIKYEMLSQILSDMDVEKAKKTMMSDLVQFAKNFSNVDSYFFFDPFGNILSNKIRVINGMFCSPFVDIETLQKLYDEVLLKNEYLKTVSHDSILINGRNLDTKIKGLYRKCNKEYFEHYLFNTKSSSNNMLNLVSERIKKIIELNKDDEEGLLLFFGKINKYSSYEVKNYLEQFDFYEKYNNDRLNELFDKTIDKLLNGDCDIDREVLESLGSYEGFLDRYDEMLELFYNSKDDYFKEVIMLPLIHGLIEKQNSKYGLNVEIEYRENKISYKNLGSYRSSSNTIFINPHLFKVFENKDSSFVDSVNTVFHEMRHALQHRMMNHCNSFDYNVLLMSMENIISSCDKDYYRNNYRNVSFERDARDIAYVETMTFFKEKPNYQAYLIEESKKKDIEDYVRLDQYKSYSTIISYFSKKLEENLRFFSEMPEFLEFYINEIKKYPVIFKFFDIDFERGTVNYKSEEYFEEQLKSLENEPDSIRKRESIYAIKNFLYSIKIDKEAKSLNKKGETLESVEREVLENVGPRPSK